MNKQIFQSYNSILQKSPSKINQQYAMYLNRFLFLPLKKMNSYNLSLGIFSVLLTHNDSYDENGEQVNAY